ncbi:alpha-glucoside-specific phosphotransferase enzyme IIB component, partial [Enterococcus sp. S181_ASV_20]|nr:alpha-glucoside-specific phosphotransferase enzyme IIB component [Enterococcus sp. S181_ASV_20]
IDLLAKVWIPLFQNHKSMIVTQLIIGLAFIVIYFFVFRFLILKFNLATPGREENSQDIKLYSKKDYKAKQGSNVPVIEGANQYTEQAAVYLDGFGGAEN